MAAAGSRLNNPGAIWTYDWNSTTSQWDKRASVIRGAATNDFLGRTLSLSRDASIIAVSGEQSLSHAAYSFKWDVATKTWKSREADNTAPTPTGFGLGITGSQSIKTKTMAMSADGNVIVLGDDAAKSATV